MQNGNEPASKADLMALEGILKSDIKNLEDALRSDLAGKSDLTALRGEMRSIGNSFLSELHKGWIRESHAERKAEDFMHEVRQYLSESRSTMLKIAEDFSGQTRKVDVGLVVMGDRVDTLKKKVKVLEGNNPS